MKIILIGPCEICKKETSKTCPRCNTVFYCKSAHRNAHWQDHKADCKIKATGAPTITLQEFLQVATEVCFDKFLIPERNVGFVGNIPMGIKNIDGKKHFLLEELPGLDIQASKMIWYEKGFSQDDYWSVFCLGKAVIFHSAIVSAMRSLLNEYGTQYNFSYLTGFRLCHYLQ
jgi:hypothetical protein